MSSDTPAEWLSLLDQLKLTETEVPTKTSLESVYFDESLPFHQENEHYYACVREEIYLSPSIISKTVELGMSADDEQHVRLVGAAFMRKVGIMLQMPNETIVIGQNIYQRFYFT